MAEIVRFVWGVFGDEVLTTAEVEHRLDSRFGYRCPDDLAKTMAKFRKAGLVKGKVSMERGGWVWWVDDECRAADLSALAWSGW